LKIYYWNDVTATSNTFFSGSTYDYPVLFVFEGAPNFSTFHFDRNTYYWSTTPPAFQAEPALAWENNVLPGDNPAQQGLYPLTQWKLMGQDANATIRLWPQKDATHMALSGSQVFLRKNKYDGRRATVTIYNWDQSDLVLADVSTILSPGDTYELHNVQNYFGDVIRGVYTGGLLNVPMNNHTVAKPFGYDIEQGPNTFREFGSFLLLNTGAAAGPLPVKFLSFNATPETKTVKLQWNTAEEQRVKYYVVERSADAVHYDSIGAVASSKIQLLKHEYTFIDKLPGQGKNYYRIKEVDLDNRMMFTSVKNVEFKFKGFDFIIVQNPTKDEIKLRMRLQLPAKMKMLISNTTGQLLMNQVKQFAAGNINEAIPITRFQKGTYFLTMSSGDEMITRSFIKQ
jgi:hypothetical protein